jgi:predicted ArsR family transcriptional regulator
MEETTNGKKNGRNGRNIIQAEHLMSFKELAEAAGMTPQGLRNHLPRLIAKGLKTVKFENGDTKYVASSWNKIVQAAAENETDL